MNTILPARPATKPGRPDSPRRACNSCRLRIAIGDTSYSVRPIRPGRFAAVKAYRLRKPDGTAYDVAELLSGPECSCPDFTVNRAERTPCKHIKALAACGLISPCPRKAGNAPWGDDRPATLIQTVEREATAYRAIGTPEGDFLGRQMDRLAQLIRFTGAADGEEHEARMAVMEESVKEAEFDRGYAEGREAGLRSAFRYREAID
jgi:hypothetical protein